MGDKQDNPFTLDDLYAMLIGNIDGGNEVMDAILKAGRPHGPQAVMMGIAAALQTLINARVIKQPPKYSDRDMDVMVGGAITDLMDIHRKMKVKKATSDAQQATNH